MAKELESADLIHAHEAHSGFAQWLTASRLTGKPWLIHRNTTHYSSMQFSLPNDAGVAEKQFPCCDNAKKIIHSVDSDLRYEY